MKISNSKKELARIISENGGWRNGSEFTAQDGDGTGSMDFFKSKPIYDKDDKYWRGEYDYQNRIKYSDVTIKNFHQTILSREEYFHLYPAPCAKPEFCESVTRSIPEPESKPTIEQLAADYRNRKDYADRKQEEADAAKADAETKLAEMVAAGKGLGLAISVTYKEPDLVITDWRDLQVGDIIRCVGYWQGEYTDGFEFEVTDLEGKQYGGELAVRVDVPGVGGTWGEDFEFIRRP